MAEQIMFSEEQPYERQNLFQKREERKKHCPLQLSIGILKGNMHKAIEMKKREITA